jgi:hypothetical protein
MSTTLPAAWRCALTPQATQTRPRPTVRDLCTVSGWSDEETRDPLYPDDRMFYKVEQWSRDGMKVERLLYAGNNLAKAEDIFARAVKHRPRIRLTIRQRTRVLQQPSF